MFKQLVKYFCIMTEKFVTNYFDNWLIVVIIHQAKIQLSWWAFNFQFNWVMNWRMYFQMNCSPDATKNTSSFFSFLFFYILETEKDQDIGGEACETTHKFPLWFVTQTKSQAIADLPHQPVTHLSLRALGEGSNVTQYFVFCDTNNEPT